MSYPINARRSVRRAYSRDMARKDERIMIAGHREGGWPAEIVWKKHVRTDPTVSGQARVNHKRNVRREAYEITLRNHLTRQVNDGLRSIDEARAVINLQPWGLDETDGIMDINN